jgi:hypothetical protein
MAARSTGEGADTAEDARPNMVDMMLVKMFMISSSIAF